jgi:predicted MFS family arabinose efflux permease
MLGMCALAAPIAMLGLDPRVAPLMVLAFLAGCGVEIFSIGWQTSLHEHVPNEVLSRVASYDALGSYVAIPVGQVTFGPLAAAFGMQDVLLVSAVLYVAIALSTLLSRSVRELGRADSEAPDRVAA